MSTVTSDDIIKAVQYMLLKWGYIARREYVLPNGRRMDLGYLAPNGNLLGVEVKITEADFNRDLKWSEYMQYCMAFYFAVPKGFNLSIIHPGIRCIVVEDGIARIVRHMGRGLLSPHLWHTASGRYAVNPAKPHRSLYSRPSGDGATRKRFSQ